MTASVPRLVTIVLVALMLLPGAAAGAATAPRRAASGTLAEGLVAHYPLDDGTAQDESGNGHNGTIQGTPTTIAGHWDNALRFAAVTDLGSSGTTIVGGTTTEKQAFIRFTVSGLPVGAIVQSAKLRLVVTNDSTGGGNFYSVSDTTWPENSRIAVTDSIDIPAGVTLTIGAGTVIKLDPLVDWTADDQKALGETPVAGFCADDAYAAAHPEVAKPYEYQAWAMINGGPVRIARFTVRRCTSTFNDKQVKRMITSVHYTRDDKWGYPDRASASASYGVVDDVIDAFPVGAANFTTDVRFDGATEFFVTREPIDAPESDPPSIDQVLMKGTFTQNGDVYSAVLEKQTLNGPSGHVAAIVVNRISAW